MMRVEKKYSAARLITQTLLAALFLFGGFTLQQSELGQPFLQEEQYLEGVRYTEKALASLRVVDKPVVGNIPSDVPVYVVGRKSIHPHGRRVHGDPEFGVEFAGPEVDWYDREITVAVADTEVKGTKDTRWTFGGLTRPNPKFFQGLKLVSTDMNYMYQTSEPTLLIPDPALLRKRYPGLQVASEGNGTLVLYKKRGSTQAGDMRVTYRVHIERDLHILGSVQNGTLVPYIPGPEFSFRPDLKIYYSSDVPFDPRVLLRAKLSVPRPSIVEERKHRYGRFLGIPGLYIVGTVLLMPWIRILFRRRREAELPTL